MAYDFDSITDRSGTWSIKWDFASGELPMWVADMDFKAAPEIVEAVKERAAHGIYGYTDIPDSWRMAYVNWWKSRHGIEIDPGWLVFCTGVVPAISSMVRKLTTPAEKVLIQPPVYNMFYNCIIDNGRQVLESPLLLKDNKTGDGKVSVRYDMDFDDLAEKMSDPQCTLMILCNPQNPSGRIWTKEELKRVGELADENGVTVISDEIHCDLCDPGFAYVPFASVSDTCRRISVTCIAPTKTFNLAGLSSAAVFAEDRFLRHRVQQGINTDEVGGAGCFAPVATVAAFEKGGQWLNELCEYIAENKRVLSEFLEKELPMVHLAEGHATYLCWLDCRNVSQDDVNLQKFLRKEAKLFVSAGSSYGSSGRGFLRINLACPRSLVLEGLKRLKNGILAYNKQAKDK